VKIRKQEIARRYLSWYINTEGGRGGVKK